MNKKILLISFFLYFNCYNENRQLKPLSNKYFLKTIEANVPIELKEIQIFREWTNESYLKPPNLNSYIIYVDSEKFKIYFKEKLQEKIAESNLVQEDNVKVEIETFSLSYKIVKDFGIIIPHQIITSNMQVRTKVTILNRVETIEYTKKLVSESNLGSPFLIFYSLTALMRMGNVVLGTAALGSSILTGGIFYFDAMSDNIERYVESDLDRYSYYLRNKLEKIKITIKERE
ncbi:MAG TPA: hypothetical protein PK079_16725 [Leptospiraceae bacterium]|nr:hypothetical protein [Leptospiraceae bacterium]HMW04202.1 hypothetical protein [Leptospiraceae bacterium]HMX32734.1 hypothetical protein [Leptospiraceae bacterium]HMY30195.1 hypothetical protein [Leptospiraceae bacterium]HMZ65178.1 hypothetical protein [Leptospiraceae bacterium]